MEEVTMVRGRDFTYAMSLDDMIEAGNYCEVLKDRGITWPTPPKQTGQVALPRLHYFGRSIAAYEALKEMEKLNVRPATLYELLRFGAENHDYYPKIHEQVILAPDPNWWLGPTGMRFIPALAHWGRDRKWGLNLAGFRWHAVQIENVSFAVVDK